MAKRQAAKKGTGDNGEAPTALEERVGSYDIRVGDTVDFIDRARFVQAKEKEQDIEPIAAVVTRLNRDNDGFPNGKVSLTVFDPDLGPLPKRDVCMSPELHPDHWTPRAAQRVQPGQPVAEMKAADFVEVLKPLVEAAVAEALEAQLAAKGVTE